MKNGHPHNPPQAAGEAEEDAFDALVVEYHAALLIGGATDEIEGNVAKLSDCAHHENPCAL
jgi:hypothetical protein